MSYGYVFFGSSARDHYIDRIYFQFISNIVTFGLEAIIVVVIIVIQTVIVTVMKAFLISAIIFSNCCLLSECPPFCKEQQYQSL